MRGSVCIGGLHRKHNFVIPAGLGASKTLCGDKAVLAEGVLAPGCILIITALRQALCGNSSTIHALGEATLVGIGLGWNGSETGREKDQDSYIKDGFHNPIYLIF